VKMQKSMCTLCHDKTHSRVSVGCSTSVGHCIHRQVWGRWQFISAYRLHL